MKEIVFKKRILSGRLILSALAMATLFFAHAVFASTNLVQNASLETDANGDGIPDQWSHGSWGTNTVVFTYPVAGVTGNGAQVTVSAYTDGDAKWFFADIPVTGGTRYSVSDQYTSNTTTYMVARYTNAAAQTSYVTIGTFPAAASWQAASTVAVAPADAVSMTVFHVISSVGTVTIDEASVTELPVVPPPTTDPNNVVKNQSLETDTNGDGIPDNWTPSSWGTNTALFTYPVAGVHGASAAKIDMTSYTDGDAKWIFDDVPAVSGYRYAFSDQYLSSVTTYLVARYADASSNYTYGLVATLPGGSGWQTARAIVTPPAGTVSVTVFHLISEVGSLTIDDASMVGSVIPPPPVTDPNNKVLNQSFEVDANGDGIPGHWSVGSWGTNSATFTYPVTGVHGDYAAKITIPSYTDGDAKWVFEDVAVEANKQYLYTDQYLADISTDLVAQYRDAAGNVSYAYLGAVAGGSGWLTSSATVVPPTGTVSFTVFHSISGVGSLTLDNVSLIPQTYIPPTDPNNLVVNQSFELSTNGVLGNWTPGRWGNNAANFVYPVTGIHGVSAAKIVMSSYTDGDAKWVFDDVPAVPGRKYLYSDQYMATTSSALVVRYTNSSGQFIYATVATAPAASNWQTASAAFTAPAGAVSMTVFHLIAQSGSLTLDNVVLAPDVTFDQGFVSLTFDDGWRSQFDVAKPIMDGANIKGTFYIISNETPHSVGNASFETDVNADGIPDGWSPISSGDNVTAFEYPAAGENGGKAAKITISNYVTGSAAWTFAPLIAVQDLSYSYHGRYIGTVPTHVFAKILMGDGSVQVTQIASVPASATWVSVDANFYMPIGADSVTVYQSLESDGSLTIDDVSLKVNNYPYIDQSEILAMQADGQEIGSHTRTHAFLGHITPEEAQIEIAQSKMELEAMGIHPTTSSIAYPYGNYNETVVQITKDAGYTSGRTVVPGYNVKTTDKYQLKVQNVFVSTTNAEISAWIDEARASKTWLILVFHQVDNSGLGVSTTPEVFQNTVTYLQTNNVPVRTVTQGIAQMF